MNSLWFLGGVAVGLILLFRFPPKSYPPGGGDEHDISLNQMQNALGRDVGGCLFALLTILTILLVTAFVVPLLASLFFK